MIWLARAVSAALLGGWLGSWALFALVVAPTAFRVLPSHEVAGDLVSPVLAVLHNYGIGAGLALALLGWRDRRGTVEVALPLLLAGLCAASEYGVTRAIAEIRATAFGANALQASAERFSELHQLSRLLFVTVLLGVLALILLRARPRPDSLPRG